MVPITTHLHQVFYTSHQSLISVYPPKMIIFTRRGVHCGMPIVETASGERFIIHSTIPSTDFALRMGHSQNILVIDVALNQHIPLVPINNITRFEVDADIFFHLNPPAAD